MKESQAARFADLLEGAAARARAFTVDRLARGITLTALGIGAAALAAAALIFLFTAVFRLLAAAAGATAAYAFLGALFMASGWLVLRSRSRRG